MEVLQKEKLGDPAPCHYITGKKWRFRYFFANGLDETELDSLLSSGWRKFGYYFFRPDCDNCRECIPIRIKTETFSPSKSQRRILKKNRKTRVEFSPLVYHEKIYELYKKHSLVRFGRIESDRNEFVGSFFVESCPTGLSLYFAENRLIGTGFIDFAQTGLSSIYYVFDTDYSRLNLGNFSILSEISYTASIGKPYYYLGYYIQDCLSMAYKNRFYPHEFYDWGSGKWYAP